jgi:Flp pilus assembly protein TadD
MTAGGRTVMAQSETQGSYLSQHSAGELAFGLNEARTVDRLEVTWPDGVVESAGPFPADTIVTWMRGSEPTAEPLPGKHAAAREDTPPASSSSSPRDTAPRSVADQRKFFGLLDQASSLRIAGDFAGAAALYRQLLELHPDHEDSLYYLGNCMVELGRDGEALEQFERLARVNPKSNRCFMQIGRIRLPGGDAKLDSLDLAEQAFDRSLAINQEESGPLVQLGVVSLLRGDLERADERLRQAAVLNVKSVEARYLRAWVKYRRGDGDAARLLLNEAQSLAKGTKPVTATVVIGEGDTKRGGALLADTSKNALAPFERWKTLATREVSVEAEFGAAPGR